MLVDPTPILADKIQFLPGKTLASLKSRKKNIPKLHPPRHLFLCAEIRHGHCMGVGDMDVLVMGNHLKMARGLVLLPLISSLSLTKGFLTIKYPQTMVCFMVFNDI